MKVEIKSLALGFVLGCLSLVIIVYVLFLDAKAPPMFRDQVLLSDKRISITSFRLVWGAEHKDRNPGNDCFALEYVSLVPNEDRSGRDQEAWDVFELIRPISELWGFSQATVSAFPSMERKGTYDLFVFKRAPSGRWRLDRNTAKVHVND